MGKSDGGAGLVCGLNLVLVLMAAGAVYFGFVRQAEGRGEDVRQAVMQMRDNVLQGLTSAAAPRRGTVRGESVEGMNAVYSSFLSDITAKRQRAAVEESRFAGLLARLEASVRENRYEEAREIAEEMEIIAQRQDGGSRYLYLARSIVRLVENAGGQSRYEESLGALQDELGRMKAEREFYRRNLQDVQTDQRFVESALSLQESNAQIQQMLLDTLREEYAKSQDALSETRARLDAGETLAIREARERTSEGYQEGVGEARNLLEQSLRIRSRDTRIAFLREAYTRYPADSAMVHLIDTLLERL